MTLFLLNIFLTDIPEITFRNFFLHDQPAGMPVQTKRSRKKSNHELVLSEYCPKSDQCTSRQYSFFKK